MALNKTTLKNELEAGFISIFNNPQINSNVYTVSEQLAVLISDKVDDYVKEGEVTGTTSDGATIVTSEIV